MQFEKKATLPSDLVVLLRERGLTIESEEEAIQALTIIGYYRFSGYAYPFLADAKAHRFYSGITFRQIINHYNFDRELRFLLAEALHHIEIAIRTCISDTISITVHPHWFLESSVFHRSYLVKKQPKPNKPPKSGYDGLLDILSKRSGRKDVDKKKCDDFIRHYYDTYQKPDYPPSWMIAEVLTFGDWSMIYSNLKSEYKQDIAGKLQLNKYDLQSWMNSLTYLRNLCAHHSRVWNRNIAIQPSINGRNHDRLFNHNNTLKLYNCIIALMILLKQIGYKGDWQRRLMRLIQEYHIDAGLMGFPYEWEKLALWKPE